MRHIDQLATTSRSWPYHPLYVHQVRKRPLPVNLTNVHPTLDLQLTHRLSAFVDVDVFWRTRNTDGIYATDGELVRAAFSTPSRYVGAQPWGELDWFIGPYLRAEVAYGHFFPDTAITDSGPGLAMNYVLVSTTFTF